MTQTFYAPPLGTVFTDDPFGHALIERYKPWLLANRNNALLLQDKNNFRVTEVDIDKKCHLPWTVLKTNPIFAHLFIQDEKLPMALPPIGTHCYDIKEIERQYPQFMDFIKEFREYYIRFAYENDGKHFYKITAHPPHSVVVPFVEPVKAETETPEPKESEESTMKPSIVTTMEKILRPEIGQKIKIPEDIEKFKVFLLLHTGTIKYLEGGDKWHVVDKEVRTETNLPFIVKGVNPDYGDIFITEAELAQAQAEAKTVAVPILKTETRLLPTAENIRDYVTDLESDFSNSLLMLKQNINNLFESIGEQKPF